MRPYFTSVILVLLFLTFPNLVFAQKDIKAKDPEAKKILDRISRQNKAYPSIRATFTYHFRNAQTGEESTNDGVITMKGKKYKLDFMKNEVYCDGVTAWNYMPGVKEVNVTQAEQNKKDFFISNPLELFNIYEADYKYRLVGELDVNGKPAYEIDLYPYDLNRPYHRVRLLVEKSNLHILRAEVAGKNGDNYDITLHTFQTDQKVDDSFFVFDPKKHPGVEVIDLRM